MPRSPRSGRLEAPRSKPFHARRSLRFRSAARTYRAAAGNAARCARMLVVRPHGKDAIEDRMIRDLPDMLRPGDVLVVNDTRVIPARLVGHRLRGEARAKIEVLLHQARFRRRTGLRFAKGAKKLKPGEKILFAHGPMPQRSKPKCSPNMPKAKFCWASLPRGDKLDEAIEALGQMPLPPYIAGRRAADARDRQDYQTPVCRAPRRRRRADREPAFHAAACRRDPRPRRRDRSA